MWPLFCNNFKWSRINKNIESLGGIPETNLTLYINCISIKVNFKENKAGIPIVETLLTIRYQTQMAGTRNGSEWREGTMWFKEEEFIKKIGALACVLTHENALHVLEVQIHGAGRENRRTAEGER